MPIIAIPVLRLNGKVGATTVLCSEERYKLYMSEFTIFEYGVSSKVFKDFLRKKSIPFEEIEASVFLYGKEPFDLKIWKGAIQVDIYDVKKVLDDLELYSEFVEKYAEKLKSL